jgi:hypothetical protein
MTDPAFEKFFAEDFQRLLERTSIPGMGEASWDRRAAWLLWRAMHQQPLPTIEMAKVDGVYRDTADASHIYRGTASAPSVFD